MPTAFPVSEARYSPATPGGEVVGERIMWIVRLALRRPYTFVVMSILIVIMGGLAIVRTPTDIFPNIRIRIAAD